MVHSLTASNSIRIVPALRPVAGRHGGRIEQELLANWEKWKAFDGTGKGASWIPDKQTLWRRFAVPERMVNRAPRRSL
jgi:hypothetical protein